MEQLQGPPPPPPPQPPGARKQAARKRTAMAVPKVKAYSVSEWSALSPAQIAAPLPWQETSLCIHHAGYKGTRGGVLMIRLGDGAGAQSLCVKPCQRLVNMDHELLAADILSAAGLRVQRHASRRKPRSMTRWCQI